jgi:hypothetical protein
MFKFSWWDICWGLHVDVTNSLKKSWQPKWCQVPQSIDLNVKIQDVLTRLHMDYLKPWPIWL